MNRIIRHRQSGFTLIEILVALAVMVIAMAALWKGLAQGVGVSQGLSNRVVARWVAENRIVSRQVMGEWPDIRAYDGSVEMGGQTWFWQEQIANTGQANLRSITVSVGVDEDTTLISLQGFLKGPEPATLSIPAQPGDQGRG